MKTLITNKAKEVLQMDGIAKAEEIIGKPWQDFTEEEMRKSMLIGFSINEFKNDFFKSIRDTYFSITWNEFINIIKIYGFELGYTYEFKHDDGKYTDEAILYYHKEKGLIIWATSYWGKQKLNVGTVYGELTPTETLEYTKREGRYGPIQELTQTPYIDAANKALSGCSRDSLYGGEKGITFSYDVREGLINKLEEIGAQFKFNPIWQKHHNFSFIDYTEDLKSTPRNTINQTKIAAAHEDVQLILSNQKE